jgi:hypothetical protein
LNDDQAFYGYLAGQFADADLLDQTDEQAAVAGVSQSKRKAYEKVLAQGRALLKSDRLPWGRIADYANRDFGSEAETRAWLMRMMDRLEDALRKV